MKITKGEYMGAETLTLTNSAGMQVTLCALGAGIMSIKVPDREGVAREVTRLGDVGYGKDYHGLTIGRTSGRIKDATFSIDGKTAVLEANNFKTDNLHGGKTGLHGKLFSCKTEKGEGYVDVIFGYFSPDAEGGYFGNVDITVTYRVLENKNEIAMSFLGVPDCKTLLNLTNHVYWNMSGDLREPVTEQTVFINASRVGVLNERLIVERIAEVTPQFDFRVAHEFGEFLHNESVQRYTLGYDHPFFLDARGLDKRACALKSELSGIMLSVATTYPCVVVYGDNMFKYKSVCFECQYHPDGIHAQPDDCGVCSPDKPYKETTVYTFTVS